MTSQRKATKNKNFYTIQIKKGQIHTSHKIASQIKFRSGGHCQQGKHSIQNLLLVTHKITN